MEEWAFFDVDGTLISRDSFLLLLKTSVKESPLRGLLLLPFLPLFLVTVIWKLDKKRSKSALLWAMTFGKGRKGAVRWLMHTAETAAEGLWHREASATLHAYAHHGVKVCCVSASGQIWLRALLRGRIPKGSPIVGSRLGFFCGGVILTSPNCYRSEKLTRLEAHPLIGALTPGQRRAAWSDHTADIPLLDWCREKHIVSPLSYHLNIFTDRWGARGFTLHPWVSQQDPVWPHPEKRLWEKLTS